MPCYNVGAYEGDRSHYLEYVEHSDLPDRQCSSVMEVRPPVYEALSNKPLSSSSYHGPLHCSRYQLETLSMDANQTSFIKDPFQTVDDVSQLDHSARTRTYFQHIHEKKLSRICMPNALHSNLQHWIEVGEKLLDTGAGDSNSPNAKICSISNNSDCNLVTKRDSVGNLLASDTCKDYDKSDTCTPCDGDELDTTIDSDKSKIHTDNNKSGTYIDSGKLGPPCDSNTCKSDAHIDSVVQAGTHIESDKSDLPIDNEKIHATYDSDNTDTSIASNKDYTNMDNNSPQKDQIINDVDLLYDQMPTSIADSGVKVRGFIC